MSQNPEQMLTWANWLLIVAASLTLVATFAVAHFGDKVEELKDRQLDRYKRDADVRISDANAKAANAYSTASMSQEKMKEADVHLEQLRLESAKLEQSNLLLQQRLESEEKARIVIEQRIKKRGISMGEMGPIWKVLYPLGTEPIDIVFPKDDGECRNLAGNLAVVLSRWSLKFYEAPVGMPPQVSINFDPADKNSEIRATAIFNALNDLRKFRVGGPFPGISADLAGETPGFYSEPPKAKIRITIGYRE